MPAQRPPGHDLSTLAGLDDLAYLQAQAEDAERGRQPKARPRPNGKLQAQAEEPVSIDPRRELTEALENVHLAARRLALPPIHVDWKPGTDTKQSDADPETVAYAERIARRINDIEAIGTGPMPRALPEIEAPTDPDAFLVEGFIRPGTTVMLAGPPGAAKSWASRQLALAAGAGLDTYLDRYSVTRPLRCLVIDEDNGPREEYRREELLLAAMGLKRRDAANVHRLSLEGVQLDQVHWQTWLRGLIEGLALDLVVLDPISEFHGGKELREDPGFRSLLAFLKRLKVDFPQLATVIVHHTRKRDPKAGGVTSVDEVRGQWGQTPDVIATLIPLGDRRSKWELHKRVPHSELILEQVDSGLLELRADEATSKTRAMQNDDRVIDAIRGGLSSFMELHEALGMSKGTLNRVLARLRQAGLVTRQGPLAMVEDGE